MLIDSEKVKETKEKIEVMEAFIDGKEIEFKKLFTNDNYRTTANAPIWDFTTYNYRIKHSEPEVFIYPIYKRLKETPETIVEFTGLDSGIYVSTHDKSIYRPGYPALNMAPHTDSSWEDYTPEYVYPIYKRLKAIPEIIVKFTSIDSGIYIGTEAQSIYKPGDAAKYMRPHTSCSW